MCDAGPEGLGDLTHGGKADMPELAALDFDNAIAAEAASLSKFGLRHLGSEARPLDSGSERG